MPSRSTDRPLSAPPVDDIPGLLARLAAAPEEDLRRPALTFVQGARGARGKEAPLRLDHGELGREVRRVASVLHGRFEIGLGDRVAVLSPNRLEVPILYLAIMRLGAIVVPLNPTASPEDWAYAISHSGARALFTSPELSETARLASAGLGLPRAFSELAGEEESEPPPAGDLRAEPAIVLYTSGTTASPKGVLLGHQSLLANARAMARIFGLDRTTQLAVLPLHHAHALGFGLMTALSTSGHLVFTDGFDPFSWEEIIRRESVEITSVVPALLPLLLKARVRRERVPTLRGVLVSSAPLGAPLARQVEAETGLRLSQGWGLSEHTNFACCSPLEQSDEEHRDLLFRWGIPSVGSPIAGAEVAVRDEQGRDLPAGQRGELWVRGPSTMLGYHRDEAATSAVMSRGWLRTGDEGFSAVHGGKSVFFITGRIKEIIIRGGEKVSPLGVEERLLASLPELRGRLAVTGFAHEIYGEEVGAYLEMAELPEGLGERLSAVMEALPTAIRPKILLHGAALIPRTHTGKVQRRKLQDAFLPFARCEGKVKIVARAG